MYIWKFYETYFALVRKGGNFVYLEKEQENANATIIRTNVAT